MNISPLVLSVPEAGRLYYGLGKDASYAAAQRGEIPCQRIGRRIVVLVHQVLKQQGMSDEVIARVLLGTPAPPDSPMARSSQDPATDEIPPPKGEITSDDHRNPTPSSSNVVHLTGR